jgi:hypothetical protein
LARSAWRPPAGGRSPSTPASYKSIESILRQGLERQAVVEQQELDLDIAHEHIRGADYYQ